METWRMGRRVCYCTFADFLMCMASSRVLLFPELASLAVTRGQLWHPTPQRHIQWMSNILLWGLPV